MPIAAHPRQNRILAGLPSEDYERLRPHLVPEEFPPGRYEASLYEEHVYFLASGLASLFYMTGEGATGEFALVGRESVVGLPAVMGGTSGHAPVWCQVHSRGLGYGVAVKVVQEEFHRGGALQESLLRYIQAKISALVLTAFCNGHHSIEQRLARWLLSAFDRLEGDEVTITQEHIAEMLGVRRMGVTEGLGRFEAAGWVRCRRGHVRMLDRSGLESQVCDCYQAIQHELGRLLGSAPDHRAPVRGNGRPGTNPLASLSRSPAPVRLIPPRPRLSGV